MRFDINHNDYPFPNKGWNLKLNGSELNNKCWKKEKLIKVITTIIECIEEEV